MTTTNALLNLFIATFVNYLFDWHTFTKAQLNYLVICKMCRLNWNRFNKYNKLTAKWINSLRWSATAEKRESDFFLLVRRSGITTKLNEIENKCRSIYVEHFLLVNTVAVCAAAAAIAGNCRAGKNCSSVSLQIRHCRIIY